MTSKKKMTAQDFIRYKQEGRKFTYLTAYDYITAAILDESDVEVVLVGDSLGPVVHGSEGTTEVTLDEIIYHTKHVVKGCPHTHVIGDMPFGSYQVNVEKAVENAIRLFKETGCDSVKLEGGRPYIEHIKAIIKAGIPVMGHIGLTQQNVKQLEGKVQGTESEAAKALIEDAKALEEAGVFSIVVESVPAELGKALAEAVEVPILGYGAGPHVDCQVLITQTMLGMYSTPVPKYVKVFADVRQCMLDGLNAFQAQTVSGEYPGTEYSYTSEDEEV